MVFIADIITFLDQCFAKWSICALYYRIFSVNRVYALWIQFIAAVQFALYVVLVIMQSLKCRPLNRFWQWWIPGYCIPFSTPACYYRTTQLADRLCTGYIGYSNDPFFAHKAAGEMEVAISFRTWRLVSGFLHPLHYFRSFPLALLADLMQSRSLRFYQGWAGLSSQSAM